MLLGHVARVSQSHCNLTGVKTAALQVGRVLMLPGVGRDADAASAPDAVPKSAETGGERINAPRGLGAVSLSGSSCEKPDGKGLSPLSRPVLPTGSCGMF